MLVGLTSALRGLATNKLRSFLTMLGVIFGVAAVIVAVALGQGTRDASMRRFQKLGTTTLTVIPGRTRRGAVSFGTVSTLKLEDATTILKSCPSVRRVSPERSGFLQVKNGNRNTDTQVYGTGADFPVIRHFEFQDGKYFTDQDARAKRMVCVIGWQVYKDLFGSGAVIGKRVYIKGQSFKVLGLFKERGGGGFTNEDDRVYVPVNTALRRLFGSDNVLSTMSVQGRSESLMQKAQDEVEQALRRRHKLAQSKASDFIIFNAGTAAATSSEQAADFEQLINCLAAVALIVGGIGIMNIMLVSVTERTREIGIRRAVGARRSDILRQFMIEAIVISVAGGTLGILISLIITNALFLFLPGFDMRPPFWILPPAFLMSLFTGVVFGVWPARKAAHIQTIDALRYE